MSLSGEKGALCIGLDRLLRNAWIDCESSIGKSILAMSSGYFGSGLGDVTDEREKLVSLFIDRVLQLSVMVSLVDLKVREHFVAHLKIDAKGHEQQTT